METFPLTGVQGLVEHKVKVKAVEYKGRKAVLLTRESEGEGLAILRSSPFADGTIEADGAVRLTTPAGARNPGFIGLAVGLWGSAGQESCFSNVRITHGKRQPIRNDGEVAGTWQFKYASDAGDYTFVMNLRREGGSASGTASHLLGSDLPVSGSWRTGYLDLAFRGTWPNGIPGRRLRNFPGGSMAIPPKAA